MVSGVMTHGGFTDCPACVDSFFYKIEGELHLLYCHGFDCHDAGWGTRRVYNSAVLTRHTYACRPPKLGAVIPSMVKRRFEL